MKTGMLPGLTVASGGVNTILRDAARAMAAGLARKPSLL